MTTYIITRGRFRKGNTITDTKISITTPDGKRKLPTAFRKIFGQLKKVDESGDIIVWETPATTIWPRGENVARVLEKHGFEVDENLSDFTRGDWRIEVRK